MTRSVSKAERLLEIEALLLANPAGLSQAELARRLGINRSTVYRYLPELTTRFPIYETDDERLAIDRDSYLVHVRLTLHEAMALHLATRMMAARSDEWNPHAAGALRKIGLALERLTPRISRHMQASADVMEGQTQRRDPRYLQVLQTITRGWAEGRKVCIRYQSGSSEHAYDNILSPYFVEPSAVGYATHVIGYEESYFHNVYTFKIERIHSAQLLADTYTIPEDFDPMTLLQKAWGIMFGEEVQEVQLYFSPQVARRVHETQWHPSQRLQDCPDGSCLLTVAVAEPLEMKPWIRGWGPECVVLGPEWLRKEVGEEMKRAGENYGLEQK